MRIAGSPRAWALFELAFRPWLRKNLAGIHLAGLPEPSDLARDLPLVLVANHTSWFDGFLLRAVHRGVRPESALLSAMLERELRGRPILRFIGGVGFDPERPLTLRRVLQEVRARRDPAPTLSYFPQGRIFPSFRSPLGFQRGIETLIRHLAPLHVLPVGIHLEGGNAVRPHAFVSAGRLRTISDARDAPSARALEQDVAQETLRIRTFLETWGEDAPLRWPPGDLDDQPSQRPS
jgi:hypothetical protein